MGSAHGLQTNVVGTSGRGDRVLLLIHGYGADEFDLAGLAPMLDPTGQCFTVCPRGPIELDFGGAGWYQRSEDGVIDPASLTSSVAALDQLLDELCQQRSSSRSSAVLIGFSQGGAMALAVALGASNTARPAGVACLSGMLQTPPGMAYLWEDPAWSGPAGAASSVPAVYVQHGVHDPMVNIERGRHTRSVLRSHGIEPEYHEYPMGHEIRPESIMDLRVWLDRVLSA
ncbi:MAG: alpha/beta hydrolase, partial [Acidimicrobiales bacterium]